MFHVDHFGGAGAIALEPFTPWLGNCSTRRMDDALDAAEISVTALMSMPVLVIGPDARTADVLALADANDIHHFPIIQDEQLVGLVSTRDLEDAAPESLVILKAWRHVITATPQCSADDAARLMRLYGVGSVVVVDDDGVWGIVTRDDLLRCDPAFERLLQGA